MEYRFERFRTRESMPIRSVEITGTTDTTMVPYHFAWTVHHPGPDRPQHLLLLFLPLPRLGFLSRMRRNFRCELECTQVLSMTTC